MHGSSLSAPVFLASFRYRREAQDAAADGCRTSAAARQRQPEARFAIGEVVKHRLFDFRGVIFDVDPVFANTEEWWRSIPEELRPLFLVPYVSLLFFVLVLGSVIGLHYYIGARLIGGRSAVPDGAPAGSVTREGRANETHPSLGFSDP